MFEIISYETVPYGVSLVDCVEKISKQIYIIYYGINHYGKISYRCNLSLQRDKKILLTVGNCVAITGHRYLIEAMKKIHKESSDAFCSILGSGELYPKEKELVAQIGLLDCIWMVGGKPHEEIPLWMNACDVFVLPSLNEGNPTVLMETLGCGKPFIGTRVDGVPEMICSEEYGLLCDAGGGKGLVRCINSALDVDWDSDKIWDYARNYTWKTICKNIFRIYLRIFMIKDTYGER